MTPGFILAIVAASIRPRDESVRAAQDTTMSARAQSSSSETSSTSGSARRLDVRVVGDDGQPEPVQLAGHDVPDPPEPDDPDGPRREAMDLAEERPLVDLPVALARRHGQREEAPLRGQDQQDRVVGDLLVVGGRAIPDRDAVGSRGRGIDVVHADAVAEDADGVAERRDVVGRERARGEDHVRIGHRGPRFLRRGGDDEPDALLLQDLALDVVVPVHDVDGRRDDDDRTLAHATLPLGAPDGSSWPARVS